MFTLYSILCLFVAAGYGVVGVWLGLSGLLAGQMPTGGDVAFAAVFLLPALGQGCFAYFTHGLLSRDGHVRSHAAQRIGRWLLLGPALYGVLFLNALAAVFVFNEVRVFIKYGGGALGLWLLPVGFVLMALQNGAMLRRRIELPDADET